MIVEENLGANTSVVKCTRLMPGLEFTQVPEKSDVLFVYWLTLSERFSPGISIQLLLSVAFLSDILQI